jgi:dTDP-4-dehydrorhamnose 3,5-epimerase
VRIIATPLHGVQLIEALRFEDERGWFSELWNRGRYRHVGVGAEFRQSNVSLSTRGVLRGLHFQYPNPQGKLISVLSGAVYDAVVDLRLGSPTFGCWYGCELAADKGLQLWVPPGFAHGFLVLSEEAIVHYACTTLYNAGSDRCLAWDDPDIGIAWPNRPGIISAKDRAAPRLRDLEHAAASLPAFEPPRRNSE